MELWQMDVVGGFLLADGSTARALTGVDDHSRFCVSARLMPRERTQLVCDGFTAAMQRHGVPQQVLTDNGKVFTGKFAQPPVEVLFDRICRENGVDHLLTQPHSPTTTGKIERFHRTLRIEFDTRQVFGSLALAQQALDEWVAYYNTQRGHQSLNDATPASRFEVAERSARAPAMRAERSGEQWVCRTRDRIGTSLRQLERQPSRAPVRLCPPHFQDFHLEGSGHLVGTVRRPVGAVREPLQPMPLVLRQPRVQGLPTHTPLGCHLLHRSPVSDDRQNRPVPLLSHAQLPHARECQESPEVGVKHQPKNRQASAEGVLSPISRNSTLRCAKGASLVFLSLIHI